MRIAKALILLLLSAPVLATTRNIAPNASGEGSIGTSSLPWGNGYYQNIHVTGTSQSSPVSMWVTSATYAVNGGGGGGVVSSTFTLQIAIGGGDVFQTTTFNGFPGAQYRVEFATLQITGCIGYTNTPSTTTVTRFALLVSTNTGHETTYTTIANVEIDTATKKSPITSFSYMAYPGTVISIQCTYCAPIGNGTPATDGGMILEVCKP